VHVAVWFWITGLRALLFKPNRASNHVLQCTRENSKATKQERQANNNNSPRNLYSKTRCIKNGFSPGERIDRMHTYKYKGWGGDEGGSDRRHPARTAPPPAPPQLLRAS